MCSAKTNPDCSTDKRHLSVVICGHVDSGKSTTTGRLLFELGGVTERELTKLKEEAARLGKKSFAFAFHLDRSHEERQRGVTIQCTTKEFFTDKWHYTVIDAPGHRDFIKNMISGASQADVALLIVPADSNFETSIQRGNPKTGKIQGQTRAHSRLLNLLGVKQVIIAINKMDSQNANYEEKRFIEISSEAKCMLSKTGWKEDFIKKSIPIIPMSGWMGDNLIIKSCNMPWWKGVDVQSTSGEMVHVHTILDSLNDFCNLPERKACAPLRVPISGIYKIKGSGNILTGRIEQGVLNKGSEVVFLPTHSPKRLCEGRVSSIEMHHTRVDRADAGDNIGMCIKGLDKKGCLMPRTGNVLIEKSDTTLHAAQRFVAQIQTLETIPNEIHAGYSPIGYVRCGHSACKITEIRWKIGRETGGKKTELPPNLKPNEMAEVAFEPMKPFVVDTFNGCEGLSRIAFLEGNSAVMLGKVVNLVQN